MCRWRKYLALGAAALLITGCDKVDNTRLPRVPVNLIFWTEADWITHGVHGAGGYERFIRAKRIPADYPYKDSESTGFGGILLCTTYLGEVQAFDLACPVECNPDVTVFINEDMNAECPVCHSCYDVFSLMGGPVSGKAAQDGYGLQVYHASHGRNGEYMVVY